LETPKRNWHYLKLRINNT